MNEKKALLIEDSIYCQLQIKEALECFPEIEIIVTDSGKSALSFLDKSPQVDLMLIDIGLPDMSGVELLEKINRAGTTVIMATHDSSIVNRRKKRVIELNEGKITRDELDGSYIVR